MKTLLIIPLLFICITSYSQDWKDFRKPPTRVKRDTINSPGNELIKFQRTYYLGSGLSILGSAVLINETRAKTPDKNIVIGGIVLSGVGFLITIYSFRHVERAGILLNENGIGIKIPIR